MQGGRGGRDDFFGFGDPFANFGGFGRPGSLISSFFGGSDPFDDPFFTRPFGSMMGPNMFGPSMFGPSMFGSRGNLFGDHTNAGLLEHQAPQTNKSKGPIIKELTSDDEEGGDVDETAKEKKENPRKHSRSGKEPYVQDPDDEIEEKKTKHMQYMDQYGRAQPQNHTYSFQSSTVTYGGHSGAYYTSSTTKRAGGGVTMEERKEADTTTGKATHKISRGLGKKGHSVTRKLNSDGRVDTMQALHNLNEDELLGFEQSWKGNANKHLPGWEQGLDMLGNGSRGGSGRGRQNGQPSRGWALPCGPQQHNSGSMRSSGDAKPPNSLNRRG